MNNNNSYNENAYSNNIFNCKHLILSGGGTKGFTYIGLIKLLEEYQIYHQIESIIGFSVGSIFLIAIGMGFFYKGLTGSNDETQVAKVFWHETRYFHGMFYVLAAIMLYSGYPKTSSLLILFDILFSIIYRIKTDQ